MATAIIMAGLVGLVLKFSRFEAAEPLNDRDRLLTADGMRRARMLNRDPLSVRLCIKP